MFRKRYYYRGAIYAKNYKYDDNFIGYEKDDDYIYGAISNKNKEIITELTISLEEIL